MEKIIFAKKGEKREQYYRKNKYINRRKKVQKKLNKKKSE